MAANKVWYELEILESRLAEKEAGILGDPEEHKKGITFIIDQLFEELGLQIYRYKDGKLVTDKDGRPKINWFGVLTGAFKLVSRIIFLQNLWEASKLQPGDGK